MIMVLSEYNNVIYVNPQHIIKITSSSQSGYHRIHTTDGTSIHTKTDIEVILDLIKKARGIQ